MMRRNPLSQVRAARMRALAEGTPSPVAFSFWDDPELLTVDGTVFEIHFNDMIDDWFGISAAMIVEALIAADGRDVLVHLNSPGGMVTEGLAIHSTFKQYAGKVTMRVEGIAASAASFVMLAADEVLIEPNAMVMVHDAWDITIGPAVEHRRTADLLDKISDSIASMYAAKSGGTTEEWRQVMTENGEIGTWYIGQEAVDAGLVDALTEDTAAAEDASTAAAARWSGIFARAPQPAAPAAVLVPSRNAQAAGMPAAITIPSTPVQPAAAAAGKPAAPFNWTALQNGLKGVQL